MGFFFFWVNLQNFLKKEKWRKLCFAFKINSIFFSCTYQRFLKFCPRECRPSDEFSLTCSINRQNQGLRRRTCKTLSSCENITEMNVRDPPWSLDVFNLYPKTKQVFSCYGLGESVDMLKRRTNHIKLLSVVAFVL